MPKLALSKLLLPSLWCALPLLLLACGGEPSPWGLQGRVRDVNGAPLAGARVVVGAQVTQTDDAGTFFLVDLTPGDARRVQVRASGHSGWQGTVALRDGAWSYVDVSLAPVERVQLADAARGGEVSLSTGLRIQFPAGAVVDASGAALSGPVTVSVAHLDEPHEVVAAPEELLVRGPGGKERRERSWGLAEVTLSAGNAPAQLARPAVMSFPLAPDWEGEPLRLTWLNPETSRWEVKSDVRVQSGRGLVTVDHFSWYGVGRPLSEEGCVELQLRLPSGRNVPEGEIVRVVGDDGLYYTQLEVGGRGLVTLGLEPETTVSLELSYGVYAWKMEGMEVPAADEDCLILGGRESSAARAVDEDDDGFPAGADCDDAAEAINPAAEEEWYDGIDADCDGESDYDQDRDGDDCAPYVANGCAGGDCDDGDPRRSSEHEEVCDVLDNDCDEATDEDALDAKTYFSDGDGDGFGVEDGAEIVGCDQPRGMVDKAGDCDDTNECKYPGTFSGRTTDEADTCGALNAAICEGGEDADDLNCDGESGSGDVDHDGDGLSACAGDCDDGDGSVSPSQTESCDLLDNDCDGEIDESTGNRWYADADGDGYGDPRRPHVTCDTTAPESWVADATDCDDLNPHSSPAREEVCDDLDNNCDGVVDEDTALDALTWYEDLDGDGYGGAEWGTACEQPFGTVANDEDCYDVAPEDDPLAATVYPGAAEVCNDGLVQNCWWTEQMTLEECRLEGEMTLAEADVRFGVSSGTAYINTIAGAGDVDGDGRADVLMANYYEPAAFLLLSSGGLATSGADVDLADVGVKLSREEEITQDEFEEWSPQCECSGQPFEGCSYEVVYSVGSAGDVDGDSRGDVLVGVKSVYESGLPWICEDPDFPYRVDSNNAVYLLLSSGALSSAGSTSDLNSADLTLVGDNDGGWDDVAMTGAGDVDGDGRADLVASVGDEGVYLLLSSGSLSPEALYAGATQDVRDADMELSSGLEHSLTAGGDVDGDGLSDVLIDTRLFLSSGALSTGSGRLVSGDEDLSFIPEDVGDAEGRSVSMAGDVDGDGRADLLIDASQNDEGGLLLAGAAYLLLSSGSLLTAGATMGLSAADLKLIGEEAGDLAGYSASIAGDVDGDGRADVVVGAPDHDAGVYDNGATYLLLSSGALSTSGAKLDLSAADLKLIGEAHDSVGENVSGAGDVNGDGIDDLLIGTWGGDPAVGLLYGRSF